MTISIDEKKARLNTEQRSHNDDFHREIYFKSRILRNCPQKHKQNPFFARHLTLRVLESCQGMKKSCRKLKIMKMFGKEPGTRVPRRCAFQNYSRCYTDDVRIECFRVFVSSLYSDSGRGLTKNYKKLHIVTHGPR